MYWTGLGNRHHSTHRRRQRSRRNLWSFFSFQKINLVTAVFFQWLTRSGLNDSRVNGCFRPLPPFRVRRHQAIFTYANAPPADYRMRSDGLPTRSTVLLPRTPASIKGALFPRRRLGDLTSHTLTSISHRVLPFPGCIDSTFIVSYRLIFFSFFLNFN